MQARDRILTACALFMCGINACLAQSAVDPAGNCPIFDATLYVGKSAEVTAVMRPIKVAYESALWNPRSPRNPMPDQHRVERVAREAASAKVPLVLDIERWHVDADVPDQEVDEHIDRLLQVIDWARRAAPGVRLGYFSLAPMPAVSWALAAKGSNDERAWRRANERLDRLAAAVDIVFPHAYTYRNDPQEWERATRRNIEEARRYGKPVYVFLWPQFHERNKDLGYRYMSDEFWGTQLTLACRHADAAVIWGGWDPPRNAPAKWDELAPWWRQLQRRQRDASAP